MFSDADLSASKYARRKRKEYPKLLDAARAGLGDRIIVYRLDRLLRIPRELEDLIELCEQRNLPVVNLHGAMDLTTAEGCKAARDRVADAAFESDLISERTRRAFDETAAEGRPHGATGGSRPFGFNDDGITHRIAEADALRAAAVDVLTRGVALSEIARRWNATGLRTRRGARWENRTVRAVLAGRRAAGLRVHREGTDDEREYPAQWDPILDEPTHRALRRALVDQPARRPGRRTEFTGLFVAVADGETWPMRRDRNQNRGVYRTYRRYPGVPVHSVTVGPAAELEELVREWLFVRVESGRLAESIAARRAAAGLARAVESAADVQAELDQLDEDKARDVIDRRGWLIQRKILVPRLRAAEAAEAVSSVSVLDRVPVDVRDRWDGYETDHRAAILREVFDRIEVAPAARRGAGFDPARVTPVFR
jgi:DNA invertase Pin-like site-specific DNA recombinase